MRKKKRTDNKSSTTEEERNNNNSHKQREEGVVLQHIQRLEEKVQQKNKPNRVTDVKEEAFLLKNIAYSIQQQQQQQFYNEEKAKSTSTTNNQKNNANKDDSTCSLSLEMKQQMESEKGAIALANKKVADNIFASLGKIQDRTAHVSVHYIL